MRDLCAPEHHPAAAVALKPDSTSPPIEVEVLQPNVRQI